MKLFTLARATAAAALMATTAGAAWSQAPLLFNSFLAPQHPINTRVLKPWADEVAAATQGRVKIQISPTSLAAPPQQMDGVKKGVFDVSYMFHGFLQENVKLSQVAHLPFVNTTAKGGSIALWRTYDKHFAKADEYKDVQVLSLFVLPPGPIYTMKGNINTVADMKGMRMYGLPGPAARILEAAGAGVVSVAAARSHEVISGGTVDAFAGYSVQDATSFNTVQYAKTIVDIPGHLTAPSFVLFMNKRKWTSLSEADRAAIMKLSGEAFAARSAVYDEVEAKSRADAAAKGVKFLTADAKLVDDLRRLGAPQEQAWLDGARQLGVDGKAALDMYRAEAQRNER
jgi:TRAP-type C4-dicarboxylate transport system substrate-binding protein